MRVEQFDAELDRLLFQALTEMENEKERLDELAKDIDSDLPKPKESPP